MQPPLSYYRIIAQLYSPLPYYCTSSGKLFLQYLPERNFEAALDNIQYEIYTPKTISCREDLIAAGQEIASKIMDLPEII
ncbi:MAG: hypothetical protein MR410_07410 [Eubacterium sp.]|nr:hypothetical protein [Eubacterium sp.]